MPLFDWLERLGRFSHFAVRSLLAALAAPARPRELVGQFYQIFLGVLPLGMVAGLAIGAVLWLQLHPLFQRFQAEDPYLPQALALAVLLEFAPIGAGLIVAGRSGANLGAELGSMRLTEQIDALEVLGLSPMQFLVGPRVLACMLTLPLLTVFIAYLALGAGFLGAAAGGMSSRHFLSEALRLLTLSSVVPAVLKTVVFGYLIGMSGCYQGMNAQGGTEGVGRAATRGVVVSIFLVLIADVFLVRLIQLLPG
jgi:phospholipid/cholesterol/gamma-HCH transport system permease protein